MADRGGAVARRRALLVVAVVALVGGVVAGVSGGGKRKTPARSRERSPRVAPSAPGKPPPSRRSAVDRLSLRQQVGALIVFSFSGTTLPAYAEQILRERRAAGVILFGGNVASPGQLRQLTAAIQRAAARHALVCTDQEGGPTRIVRFVGPARPQSAVGTAATGPATRSAGRALRRLGVNVDLAPVADVATGAGSVMLGRAYPGSAAAVAAHVAAAVRGYLRGGVAPTLKHFPGFGAAAVNTDNGRSTIASSDGALRSALEPFRAGIDAGAPLVMVAHALYPAYDSSHIASQSPAVIGDLLRKRLHFGGVVMTDSLEARAVLSRSTVSTAAVRSIQAGADVALLTGPGSYRPVYRALLARARSSLPFRARVRESAARVWRVMRAASAADGRLRPRSGSRRRPRRRLRRSSR